jgi:hypothetical protein
VDVRVGVGVRVKVGVNDGDGVAVSEGVAVGVRVGGGVFVTVGVKVGRRVHVFVGVGVSVVVGVMVGVSVGVAVGRGVRVGDGLRVGVRVGVSVGVRDGVGVLVSVGVHVGGSVRVGVGVNVGVRVPVAVPVLVGVRLGVHVAVTVRVAEAVHVAVGIGRPCPRSEYEAMTLPLGPETVATATKLPTAAGLNANSRWSACSLPKRRGNAAGCGSFEAPQAMTNGVNEKLPLIPRTTTVEIVPDRPHVSPRNRSTAMLLELPSVVSGKMIVSIGFAVGVGVGVGTGGAMPMVEAKTSGSRFLSALQYGSALVRRTSRPLSTMSSRVAGLPGCPPLPRRLADSVAPVARFWTKTSLMPLVSTAIQLLASDSNATKLPSAEIAATRLAALASPPCVGVRRRMVCAQRSRTKTSA